MAVSETMHAIQVMERMAKNKDIDVTKMREIRDFMLQVRADSQKQEFDIALAAAQEEMEPIRADAYNGQTKSNYASHAALDRAIRPIYTRHGFTLSFDTEEGAPEGFVRVVCYVSCKGHTEKRHIDMGNTGKGAKGGDVMTTTHAAGSAVTYGQRYLKKMIFDISVDRDDDGNRSSGPRLKEGPKGDVVHISSAQITELQDAIKRSGVPLDKFLGWARVALLEDIPADFFESCLEAINSYKGAK